MRRILVFDHVSADGWFASEDGRLDWVIGDEELMESNLRNMAGSDTLLFGRRTYDMFEAFWPNALRDPQGVADPHAPGRRSETTRRVGEWIDNAVKLVFSRTRSTVTWRGSRLLREFDAGALAALKRQPGKNLLVLGSGELTRLLARHGLIDEYQFGVVPVILGKGRKLLDGLDQPRNLSLLDSRSFPTGTVLLRYAAQH